MATLEKVKFEEPITVNLGLTASEAEALALVLRNVGGSPTGRRGKIDNIFRLLAGAGMSACNIRTCAEGTITLLGGEE